jgi:hypothetical protein
MVVSGSFIEPGFCLDLCRILAHMPGVVSLVGLYKLNPVDP